jgi:ABC-type iron transport system FetAB permease component
MSCLQRCRVVHSTINYNQLTRLLKVLRLDEAVQLVVPLQRVVLENSQRNVHLAGEQLTQAFTR